MKTSIRRRRVQPQHDAEYYIKLKIDKTGLTEQFINPCKGRGVIATQLFKQGDFILEYRGKLSKVDPYLQRDKFNDTVEVFLFDFKWKGTCWCIDASIEDKSLGRLVNDDHRRPNCKMKTVEVEGIPHLCLFALRDIEPGEEITYNYGKADWPWRKMDKSSTPEVSNQTGNDEHRHQDKSTPEVSNQTGNDEHCAQDKSSTPEVSNQTGNDEHRHQEKSSSPEVSNQTGNDEHRHQDKSSTPEVSNQTGNDEHRHQDKSSSPEVSNQTGNDEHRHQDKSSSPEVSNQTGNDEHRHQDKSSTPEVSNQTGNDEHRHQSRLTKLRQHHEKCLKRHRMAEEEHNAKEKHYTMILMKRAKLAQELAKLDALLKSQPENTTDMSSQHDIQPLPSSDSSFLEELRTSERLEKEQQARVPSVFSTSPIQPENCSVEYLKKRPSRQKQVSTYTETSFDESDYTDYSDADYIPDSEGSSSQKDEDVPLNPIAKKPLPSLRYPHLSPSKQDISSEISVNRNVTISPKKKISETPRKRRFLSQSATNSNESTPKKSRVEEISDSIRVLPPLKSGNRRVYNKRNYCLYCLQPTSKLARHLEAVHKNVEEVALAFQYPKNSRERRNRLNMLRRRGNFAHNASVVKRGAGELQACYRPRKSRGAIDFIHCYHCQGLYAKKTLWKHMRRCPAKKESNEDSKNGKQRVRSKCALKTAVARDIGEGLKTVISCMKYDEITQLIQNDQLLLQFGQHLYDLNGSRKNRHDYIRQRLRELGRLLLTTRKNTAIQKAEELIYPANFNHLISAVKELAGYNPEGNTFQKPSLALKIGNNLGIISELVETDNLSSEDGDPSLVQFAREFRMIKNFRWKGLITRGATTTMKESKWNAPQILPLTDDVKCLDSHMETVKAGAEKVLRLTPTPYHYAMLAKVTLAQVIIFNRRREGEVSRMELSTFKDRKKSEINVDMTACLTPLENKMCDFFTRVEIRGKRGRGVPVLLKPSMVSAMELLVETRESCGVPKENIYMFARPGALSACRGGDCIQMFAKESGAKHPEFLTSTRLRKHIATMSQVLNLQENEADQLADFLGHDIRVHRQYYRLPQGTLQLAKMSKVLLAVENGTLSHYKGQTLDDIEIDPEEKVDLQDLDSSSDESESLHSAMETTNTQETETTDQDEDTGPGTSSGPTTCYHPPLKKGNQGNSKRKWEDREVRAVERHMMRFIHTCKVPQKLDCIRCINAEPYALKDRTWTGVKNYVRNRITALKRRACAKD
ncbi:uncharacterized protein LOC115781159 isoform X6 [Archocentrus centrarchus]|uniref:uncharacterized protein LOC115781159 isoform X6 n=1 Tax=Archocentrus centrarchus TaxID=63155 RepID=UPI0011EA065E|nr:uncharacterized protein LOC115781159 isoform X6 [Archocentrus centrarchus]